MLIEESASDAKVQLTAEDGFQSRLQIGWVMLAVAVELNCDIVIALKSDLITCLDRSADAKVVGEACDKIGRASCRERV